MWEEGELACTEAKMTLQANDSSSNAKLDQPSLNESTIGYRPSDQWLTGQPLLLSEIRQVQAIRDESLSRWNSRTFWIMWEKKTMAVRKAQVEDMLPHWMYAYRYALAVMREQAGLKGDVDGTNPFEIEILKKAADVALFITGKVKF